MPRITNEHLAQLEASGKVARGSTIAAPSSGNPGMAIPGRSQRSNKFGVSARERRTVDGIVFASRLEAARYVELKELQQMGAIVGFLRQVTFTLGVPENRYRVDFLVFSEYGACWAEDTKGMTRPADLKNFKLWAAYAPCDLRVMKRKKLKWETQVVRGKR